MHSSTHRALAAGAAPAGCRGAGRRAGEERRETVTAPLPHLAACRRAAAVPGPARRRRAPWPAALLLLALHAASADEPPPSTLPDSATGSVDIEVGIGFSDTVRLGHFAPLTVTLGNRGAALAGRVEVLAPDGDPVLDTGFTVTHARPVELLRDSRKRLRFTVYVESFTRPLVVRLVAGERVVARRSVDLRQRVTTARLLLVLSRDADLDALNDPRVGSLRVLYPLPELLPDRWQGYDGVVAMVLHGLSLERLGSEQFEALREWLAHGGVLVVSGGPDYSLLGTPRLAELLPGVPDGQVVVDAGAGADTALRTLPVEAGGFDVNRVPGHTGTVLMGSPAQPLAIERRVGRGRVVYLTFDVTRDPFRRWTGMRQLWLDLLRLPPPESLASQLAPQQDNAPLRHFLTQTAGVFPGRAPLLLFLAVYLGALAIGQGHPATGGGPLRARAALAWLTPLLFAVAAQLVFGGLLFPKRTSSFAAGVVLPHGQGAGADLELHLGWYANHRTDLRLEYAGAEPSFRPAAIDGVQGRHDGDWLFVDPPHGALQPPSSRGYELHVVRGEDVIDFDLQAELTLTAGGPALAVRNHSGRAVADAWLVLRGAAYPLGTIAPDAAWSRTLDPARDAVRIEGERWFNVLRGAAQARGLAHAVLAARAEPGPPADAALLVGQVHSPFRLTGASASWSHREIAVLLATVPLAAADHGRRDR